MADLEWQGRPERASLRRALRHALRCEIPALRVLAEDYLAESSAIDLLARGAEGELVSIRIGGEPDEARLFTRALADLSWLEPRVRDLLKLAPELGLAAEAEPRAMIFCPRFSSETRSAARRLPGRSIELLEYRCVQQKGQLALLLERCEASLPRQETIGHETEAIGLATDSSEWAGADPLEMAGGAIDFQPDSPPRPLTDPPSQSTFRTGLSDEDLRVEPSDEGRLHPLSAEIR